MRNRRTIGLFESDYEIARIILVFYSVWEIASNHSKWILIVWKIVFKSVLDMKSDSEHALYKPRSNRKGNKHDERSLSYGQQHEWRWLEWIFCWQLDTSMIYPTLKFTIIRSADGKLPFKYILLKDQHLASNSSGRFGKTPKFYNNWNTKITHIIIRLVCQSSNAS